MLPVFIAIEGFGSVQRKIKIKFPQAPGVHLVTGRNDLQPKIDPNGVGKSTIFNAMLWAIAGKTSVGAKAGKIVNWQGVHHTSVKFGFWLGNDKYVVDRHQSPNALRVRINGGEWETIAQEELDSRLGIDYDRFLFSVFFAQFGTFFMDCPASKQAQLLSRVLPIEQYKVKADEARKRAGKTEKKVQELTSERDKLQAMIEANKETRKRLRQSLKQWDKEQKEHAANLQAQIAKQLEAAEQFDADATTAFEERDLHDKRAQRLYAKLKSVNEDLSKRREQLQELALERSRLKHQIGQIEEKHALLESGACPTCGRKFTKQDKLSDVATEVDVVSCDLIAVEGKQDKVRKAIQALDEQCTRVTEKREAAQLMSSKKQREASEATHRAHQARSETQRLKDEQAKRDNPFTIQVKAVDEENERLAGEVVALEEKIDKGQQLHEGWSFLAGLFPKVRLFALDNAAKQLAAFANDALPVLGLNNWGISCRTTRTLVSGSETAEFGVDVRAPGAPESVPFSQWSGGESQLLRVAVAAGFSELATTFMQCRPKFEIWDEPTAHLSDNACQALIAYLAHRAQTLGKVIYIIDHRVRFAGEIAGELFLVKDAHGTRVESSNW